MNENAIQTINRGDDSGVMLSMKTLTDRVNMVHKVMDTVMKKGTHFGTVPGCGDKMVLLKPGADVLAMTFKLVPRFDVTKTEIGDGHREYDVTCSMYAANGELLGQGVGSGSTMEKKYRYRWEGSGNSRKKVENEDIADVYNTVLKMAKKRAHVDATLTVTGAGDMFTQDLIDDDEPQREPVTMPKATAAKPKDEPKQQAETPDAAETVTGQVETVSHKSGKSAKGEWTRYGVKVDGTFHNSFSDTVGNDATYANDKGLDVTIVYTTNDKGFRDIVSLDVIGEELNDDVPM